MNVPDADVTDFDGNVYNTVKIGTQVWMVRNLNVTHFRNGAPILYVTGNALQPLSSGAYCNYDNDINNSAIYGRLYNWWAVNDSRNISPPGWHVASDAEWSTLAKYLGGNWIAADKLMEKGNTHWQNASATITNEAGFYALPGGVAFMDRFFYLGFEGNWWSSTREMPNRVVFYNIQKIGGLLSQNKALESNGFSIRLIQD